VREVISISLSKIALREGVSKITREVFWSSASVGPKTTKPESGA
jgi:hypothetical protein